MRKRCDVNSFEKVTKDFQSAGDDLRNANPFRDQAQPKKKEPPSLKTLRPILIPLFTALVIIVLVLLYLAHNTNQQHSEQRQQHTTNAEQS